MELYIVCKIQIGIVIAKIFPHSHKVGDINSPHQPAESLVLK